MVFVGGSVIEGDLCNGSVGSAIVDGREVILKVLEVGFLERAQKDAIIFSVQRPLESPELVRWVGALFAGPEPTSDSERPPTPRG